MDQQWAKKVNTPDEAERYIRRMIPVWRGNWKSQINHKVGLANMKPFNLRKFADASSSEGPEGFDGYEGMPPDGTVSPDAIIFGKEAHSAFQKGTIVRLRAAALGYSLPEGRVIECNEGQNYIKVLWNSGKHKGKVTRHNLADTALLDSTFEIIGRMPTP